MIEKIAAVSDQICEEPTVQVFRKTAPNFSSATYLGHRLSTITNQAQRRNALNDESMEKSSKAQELMPVQTNIKKRGASNNFPMKIRVNICSQGKKGSPFKSAQSDAGVDILINKMNETQHIVLKLKQEAQVKGKEMCQEIKNLKSLLRESLDSQAKAKSQKILCVLAEVKSYRIKMAYWSNQQAKILEQHNLTTQSIF